MGILRKKSLKKMKELILNMEQGPSDLHKRILDNFDAEVKSIEMDIENFNYEEKIEQLRPKQDFLSRVKGFFIR